MSVQTLDHPEPRQDPNDPVTPPDRGPIGYVLHAFATGGALRGPLDPAIARVGQQIVDTAFASAGAGRTLPLIG